MHTPKWGLFFDFHTMPANPDVGKAFDLEAIGKWFKDCRADFVVFHARCNLGTAYYPTKLGIRHPAMVGDLYGDLVRICHANGIAISAYINVGLSHEEATTRINAQARWILDMRVSSPSVADVTVVLDHSTKRSLLVFEDRHFVLGHGKWIGHAGLKKASSHKDNEGGKGEDSHIEQFRS